MANWANHGRLAAAVLLGAGSCSVYDDGLLGDVTEPSGGTRSLRGSTTNGGTQATGAGGSNGGEQPGAGGALAISTIRIEPADALISVALGEVAKLAFSVYGASEDHPDEELDITDRAVFYVPDNHLVGGFPQDGSHSFSTRLPAGAEEPVQRGGVLTVEAQARARDGSILTATTSLTVKLTGELVPAPESPEATPALPDDPAGAFEGPLGAGSPVIVYPTNGVIFPRNVGRVDVHFQSGAAEHSLFEVAFKSPLSELRAYTRCYASPAEFLDGSCTYALGGPALESLALTNGGTGPVTLTVRATDELGAVAESQAFDLEFTADRVEGALYYWTATEPTGIVRLDFGNVQTTPETFLVPADIPDNNGACVGCHALSPAGDKVFIGLGNSARGELVYIADLSKPRTASDFITYNGALLDQELAVEERKNRVLFGAFAPDGSEFVAVGPRNDPEPDTRLFIHDVATGQRATAIDVPFVPSHVDWSADGQRLAVTAIGSASEAINSTTLEFLGAGISVIERTDGVWQGSSPLTIVPPVAGKNRYNPTFIQDGSLLLFTEVDQASYTGSRGASCDQPSSQPEGRFCNGYSDPGAKTWAVEPSPGASPVYLARAAMPGPMDVTYPPPQPEVGPLDFMDTFPRAAPFPLQHRGRTIYFVTMSSQRRAGLREFFANDSVVGDPATQVLLWMFAIDPERVKSGEDGSYPAFFLPFQNLTTSNHMAVWTQKIISSEPAPEPAPEPQAPPRPALP